MPQILISEKRVYHCTSLPVLLEVQNCICELKGVIFPTCQHHYALLLFAHDFNDTYVITYMQVASVQEFYRKVQAVAPALKSNQQLRLIQGRNELREGPTTLQDLGIHHGSSVFAVIRTVGGGDPRVTMLLNCPEKNIGGVKSPSLRACPHCGALVEHTDACKHMKCPACSNEFCFIFLSKRDANGRQSQFGWMIFQGQTGWKCGRYNSPCASAARQTSIPYN